jgi:type III pantothenate kinase
MLLTVDVGNTNISYGIFDGKKLVDHLRTQSARERTADEYAVLLRQMMELRKIDPDAIDGGIVASVVPQLTDTIVSFIERAFAIEPVVVGPGTKTGMPVLSESPREVGADRVVNAVAAFAWAKGGVIAVDFGTATTFDCVSPKGEYLGGAIAPGIVISADALFNRASRLHRVEITRPERVVGKNTTHSMQSGLVFGYAGLVDGLCRRLKAELAFPCRVIATGGLARLVAPETDSIEEVDDHLTLKGLQLIHERTHGRPPSG